MQCLAMAFSMPLGFKVKPSRDEVSGDGNSGARLIQRQLRRAFACLMVAGLWLCALCPGMAWAAPALVVEYPSGAVLFEDHATQPWYPASLTKLMTAYVALKAVREHRLSLDTPLVVSARATAMPPSKMGFRPGTLVTLGNALKMIMVKSANDTAVTIAEGVSGSVEAFADEMNEAAASLGLKQSHFVNPNGLPNPQHVSSARDLAILAVALYSTYPEHADLFGIGALRLDGQIITNHNNLLGRYPGVDGMKTGFTCAAGFNVVASATQGGRKLIAVVLGAPNVAQRTIKAAALFDRGFAGVDRPGGSVAALQAPQSGQAPDMNQSICRRRGKAIAEFNAETERLIAPLEAGAPSTPGDRPLAYNASALAKTTPMARRIALVPAPSFEPTPIFVGAPSGYAGPVAQARPAHSPLGTEPPAEAASAYAPANPATLAESAAAPLAPDPSARTMRLSGKRARLAAIRAHGRRHAQARAEPEPEPIGSKDAAPSPTKTKTAKGGSAEKAKPAGKAKSVEKAKPAAKAKTAEKKAKPTKPAIEKAAIDKRHPAKPATKLAQKQAGETKTAGRANKAKPGHSDANATQ